MRGCLRDLFFAIRQLRKSPGFTLTAVLSLAIGIGINTAIFSSMDAVVLRPLAVPALDRVLTVSEQQKNGGYEAVALANYVDWSRQSRSFEELAAREEAGMNLTGAGDATHVEAALTTASFFSVLRAEPVVGRLYTSDECKPGADGVALLNYGFWQRHFGGDRGVIGRKIELDQRGYSIIGVLPRTLQYPSQADVFLPLAATPRDETNRTVHKYFVLGRLREGETAKQAQAELRTVAEQLAAVYPATNQGWSVHVEPLLDGINGPETPLYYRLMLGGTIFVLLVVCANVANLQLARSIVRRPEIAMRMALGASRWRVMRQLLTENIVLGLLGAAGGVLVGAIYLHITLITMPERVARYMSGWSNVTLNGRALGFSLLLALAAGALAGLAPAVEALHVNVVDRIKTGSRGSTGPKSHRLRELFAVSQIALAVALVVGAALMAKGLNAWLHIAEPYRPNKMLTFGVTLPEARYGTAEKRADWYRDSLARLRSLPGVTHAELAAALPYNDDGWVRDVAIENRPSVPGKMQSALHLPVSSGYFAELQIPIVDGRGFEPSDSLDSTPVAVVSERFVSQYFPGEDPLGHRIRMGGHDSHEPWLTIVGVAKETNYSLWDPMPHAAVFMDTAQLPPSGIRYAVTTDGDPLDLARAVRSTLSEIDPALPLNTVETYSRLLKDNLTGLIYAATLLGIDALLALLLAAIGIFGVMANLVGERTREIGVRLAMGAQPADVLRLILRRASWLTAAGVGTGLVMAFTLARLTANLLRGVRPDDPVVFIGITAAVISVSVGASWIPARRGAHIEPMVALRHD